MIIPDPSAATAPFWEGAARHSLLLLYCPACQSWHHPQVSFCPCGRGTLEWRETAGRGRLISFTVVRQAPLPALSELLPYTLMLVKLEEGPQLVSSLPGEHSALKIGSLLQVWYDEQKGGVTLPRFKPLK